MVTVDSLFGRESEMETVVGLIEGVRDCGGALVVSGEPGIGKSALLAVAVARAKDLGMRVLRATGVQSEAQLAFSGLHQLVKPLLRGIGRLPTPQRDAIGAALGMTDGAAPDLFLIGLAVLNLIANAANETPVLVVAEDAHWLDQSSSDVLAFVARRLESEPVAILAAIRDGFDSSIGNVGLPSLHIGRLGAAAADALLDAKAPPDLEASTRQRLLREAAGNPLALVELPLCRGSTSNDSMRVLSPPLSERLERAFAAREKDLQPRTRALLLAGAVNDTESVREALTAAALIAQAEVTLADLTPAVQARLVDLDVDDSRLRFRHPLVRSAIRQAANPSQRRAAHVALASVLVEEPDRRAWHLAASTVGTDEVVAAELDVVATRAQRRGSMAAAAAALERAAQLSDEKASRTARLLQAAELAFQLGRRDQATSLVGAAEPLAETREDFGRIALVREMDAGAGLHRDPVRLGSLVATAEELYSQGQRRLALNLLWGAASACYWSDPGLETRETVISAIHRIALDDSDSWRLVMLACAAPIEYGATISAQLTRPGSRGDDHHGSMRRLGQAAICIGAYDLAKPLLEAASNRFRAEGRLGLLAQTLSMEATAEVADGRQAIATADEAVRLSRETAQPLFLANALAQRAMLAAIRGDEEAAVADANEAEQATLPFRSGFLFGHIQLARGLTALSSRRYEEAYSHLRPIFEEDDRAHHPVAMCRALGTIAEAAAHSGRADDARQVLDEVGPLAERTPSPVFGISLRHARAMLSDDELADEAFSQALGPELAAWPFDLARLKLANGERLRRTRRSSESRVPLRSARDTFDALGAKAWSERARQELRASGETSRQRHPEARDELTPQEHQIAQMAARGLTNREIGQLLYLSHRTISSHLYRIFPKLGITSRAELRDTLQPGEPEHDSKLRR